VLVKALEEKSTEYPGGHGNLSKEQRAKTLISLSEFKIRRDNMKLQWKCKEFPIV
jgi:hypothetical protein